MGRERLRDLASDEAGAGDQGRAAPEVEEVHGGNV